MGCTDSKTVKAKTAEPVPVKAPSGDSLKEKPLPEKEPETQVYSVKQHGPDGVSESVKIITIHPDEGDDIEE